MFIDGLRNNQCFNIVFAAVPTIFAAAFLYLAMRFRGRNRGKMYLILALLAPNILLILADVFLVASVGIMSAIVITLPIIVFDALIYFNRNKNKTYKILAVTFIVLLFLFYWTVISYMLRVTDTPRHGCFLQNIGGGYID